MAWWSGEYVWKKAKEPHKVRVFLTNGQVYEEDFFEDLVYYPAKVALIDMDLGKSARHRAVNYADRAVRHGMEVRCKHEGKPHKDVFYGPTFVKKAEVIRCKWEAVVVNDSEIFRVNNNAAQESPCPQT